MACRESVEVKVEVKKEEELEASSSTSSRPPAKRKRVRKKATPEQKERDRLRKRERNRKIKLEMQKRKEEGLPLTEELEEEERRRCLRTEQQRQRRARMRQEDPKGYKEMMRQKNKSASVKKAAMTEEELKQYKLKQYLRNHAYYMQRGRWRDRPEEEKEKARKLQKEWVQNLSGEKKKRYLEGVKRAQKKMFAKLKEEDPEKFKRVYGSKPRWRGYEKMKEDPAKWEMFCEKHKAYQRKRYATETPEERERRRWKEKVNAARRRLKKQLEKEGVWEEEIQRRDEELKVRMWKEFDPEGEVPGSTTKYRWKKKRPPKIPADSTSTRTQAENDEWFGGDDYFASSPPPSPCSSPMPPTSVTSSFPEPPTATEVQTYSRYDSSTEEFQCSHCSSTFQDEVERRVHIQLIHPSSCWKCPKCAEMVLSPAELSQHYNSVHKRIQSEAVENLEKKSPKDKEKSLLPFQCMRCPPKAPKPDDDSDGKFKTRLELLSHVKRSHPGSYWPCKDCHLLKYSEQSLQVHLTMCRFHQAKRRGES